MKRREEFESYDVTVVTVVEFESSNVTLVSEDKNIMGAHLW